VIDPGARSAWRRLESSLRPFVARRVASAADVDDLVQEVFARMHRALPALRDEARFGPWLYRIARSAIADHQRQAARHPLASEERLEEPSPPPDDDERSVARELASALAPFVSALPSPYREAITLADLGGLTQSQAAAVAGISLPGMKARVQRGRARLRKALEDCCQIALDARRRVIACEPRTSPAIPRRGCCA